MKGKDMGRENDTLVKERKKEEESEERRDERRLVR